MDEDTAMYYRQLARSMYPDRPTLTEVKAYLEAHGAEVEHDGTSLRVTWPAGTGFYE